MGAFGGLVITNKGRNLQSKAQTGIELRFTRIGVGDGTLSGQSIPNLTNLISPKMSLELTKLKVLGDGKATVGGVLSNQDVSVGFYFREIGLFANDPDEGEILYCYGNAGSGAEYIPPTGGADVIEKQIDIVSIIGNASNVTAQIASAIYASVEQLEEVEEVAVNAQAKADTVQANLNSHIADYVRQPGYAVDTGTANAKVVTLNPAPVALVDGLAISFKNAVQNTGTVTLNVNGLGPKAIVKANGNELASGNLKAGSIYTVRYNATTGNFILQGEGGEYGTAGPAQVLSGYTVGTENGVVPGTFVPISVKSVQNGVTVLDSSSKNVVISSVDVNKSLIIFTVKNNNSSNDARAIKVKGKIMDSTTINFSIVVAGDTNVSWQVIEFDNVKSLQKGDLSLPFNSGTGPNDITVSNYNPSKSILLISYTSLTYGTLDTNKLELLAEKINNTTIRITRTGSTLCGFDVHWQLIEFN